MLETNVFIDFHSFYYLNDRNYGIWINGENIFIFNRTVPLGQLKVDAFKFLHKCLFFGQNDSLICHNKCKIQLRLSAFGLT